MTGEIVELPESGPGHEQYKWPEARMASFSKEEAKLLRTGYDKILEGDGFPADHGIAVEKADKLLTKWTLATAPVRKRAAKNPTKKRGGKRKARK